MPYPFLNNMTLGERGVFYATNIGLALGLLLVFAAIGWGIRRAAR